MAPLKPVHRAQTVVQRLKAMRRVTIDRVLRLLSRNKENGPSSSMKATCTFWKLIRPSRLRGAPQSSRVSLEEEVTSTVLANSFDDSDAYYGGALHPLGHLYFDPASSTPGLRASSPLSLSRSQEAALHHYSVEHYSDYVPPLGDSQSDLDLVLEGASIDYDLHMDLNRPRPRAPPPSINFSVLSETSSTGSSLPVMWGQDSNHLSDNVFEY